MLPTPLHAHRGRRTPSRAARGAGSALLAILLLTLAWAGSATAAPVAYPDPSGSGAVVTLSSTELVPGQRIEISGTGFARRTGASGRPWIAIKIDVQDLPWDYGGDDAIGVGGVPGGTDDAAIWFAARPDGSFSGWIDVPETGVSTSGPGCMGASVGRHCVYVLSGGFSSDDDSQTEPISYPAWFDVVDRVQVGATSASGLFQRGTTFRPGAAVTLRGRGLDPSSPVTATLDGDPLTTSASTDADGTIVESGGPAPNRVTLPADVAPGGHTLAFSTGTRSATVPITVVPAPTATLRTPSVRPGGLLAYDLRDYVGVSGAGQLVAIQFASAGDTSLAACVQTDAHGDARGVVPVPAVAAGPTESVRFLVGTRCTGPGGVQDDLPQSFAPRTLAIAADAPSATLPAQAVAGTAVPVAGSGFAAGEQVVVELDGADTPTTFTVDGTGAFSGTVTAPAAGDHALVLRAPSAAAAALLTTTAPVPDTGGGGDVDPGPGGGDGGGQTVPTTPTTPTAPTGPTKPAPTRAAKVASKALRPTKKGRVSLSLLRPSVAGKAAVSVTSKSKVRLKGAKKARILTLVRAATFSLKAGTAKQTTALSLKLTADAKALLKRVRSVKVVVRVAPKGGKAFTKTLVLRR